jgi:hypothetical protein
MARRAASGNIEFDTVASGLVLTLAMRKSQGRKEE